MLEGNLNGIFFLLPLGGVIIISLGGGSSQKATKEIAIAVNDKRDFGSFDIGFLVGFWFNAKLR